MPADRFLTCSVIGFSVRQVNAARVRKTAYAIVAGFAVNVTKVIAVDVETRVGVNLGSAFYQEIVEHVFPSGGVDLGGLCDHAIEVEDERIEMRQQNSGIVVILDGLGFCDIGNDTIWQVGMLSINES